MDYLHHDLFEALEQLSAVEDSEFVSEYARIVHRLERVFRAEEDWMDETNCVAALAHQEQHARALSVLHQAHARIMAGDITFGRDLVMNALPQWLAFHSATMDLALSLSIQEKNKKEAASQQ
ncbi:hemerythrin family protein [Noviherbaspirillum saxi]|uniref:hemerythrin family protein n=1 Tax=Noviherbaspirillum saxi TaxID=2320863 RepID=UPI0011C34781|nr:hemerythrin family protein [Noviherbaspirillum saxi]